MDRFVPRPNYEIISFMMETRLRASPRHGGQNFFKFFVTDLPWGCPFEDSGSYLLDGTEGDHCRIIPENYDFYWKIQRNLNTHGISLSPLLVLPNGVSPGKVLHHHHAQRRGGLGGQVLSPPSYCRSFLISRAKKGILQGPNIPFSLSGTIPAP